MGQGRPQTYLARLLGTFACVLLAVCPLVAAPPVSVTTGQGGGVASSVPAEARDAELFAVTTTDAEHVWAVGQHGVIWHTGDAGQTWQLQRYARGQRLEGVCFVDHQFGWAVGRETRPLPAAAKGVVLITRDGGRNWEQQSKLLLPALNRVRFFDRAQGIAIGDVSSLYSAGIVATEDGGQSWTPLATARTAGFAAGEFRSLEHGILAQRCGNPLRFQDRRILPSTANGNPFVGLHGFAYAADSNCWAVGDGGTVLLSGDAGATWQSAINNDDNSPRFDWQSIATSGDQVWIAGSPGSRVLHSPDAGRSWQYQTTGQQLPLNSIHFANDTHGVAVGSLGAILTTDDGGETWRTAQTAAARVAWCGLFSDPQSVPLELVAKLSAGESYLGCIGFVLRRDLVALPDTESDLPERCGDLFAALGLSRTSFAWQFPTRERGLTLPVTEIVRTWNCPDADAAMEEYLVRMIRVWRPEIVFTGRATAGDPLEQLIHQAVLRAVQSAAKADQFSEQIESLGIAPWAVKRIYRPTPGVNDRGATIVRAEIMPHLGSSIEEFVEVPRAMLLASSVDQAPVIGFEPCAALPGQSPAQGAFFTGIRIQPQDNLRRQRDQGEGDALRRVRNSAQRAQNLRAITQLSTNKAATAEQVLTQVNRLLEGVEDQAAGTLLFQLGQRQFSQGRWSLAIDHWKQMVERFPDHSLAATALARLLQFGASGEAALRVRGDLKLAPFAGPEQAAAIQAASYDGTIGGEPAAIQAAPIATAPPVAAPAPGAIVDQRRDLLRLTTAAAAQLERLEPILYSEPVIRFPLGITQRVLGAPDKYMRYVKNVQQTRPHDAWWAAAMAEIWLGEPLGAAPSTLFTCVRADQKPHLDGRFEDATWQHCEPTELASPYRDDRKWPASVMLAHDGEYLYVALTCSGDEIPSDFTELRRPRDSDQSGTDRVHLRLDLDRDYGSYYELVANRHGSTGELCLGDATWNPRWFVATANADNTWTAEFAIGFDELCAAAPRSGDVWACGITRVLPSHGFQTITGRGGLDGHPAGVGLLRFE